MIRKSKFWESPEFLIYDSKNKYNITFIIKRHKDSSHKSSNDFDILTPNELIGNIGKRYEKAVKKLKYKLWKKYRYKKLNEHYTITTLNENYDLNDKVLILSAGLIVVLLDLNLIYCICSHFIVFILFKNIFKEIQYKNTI